MATKPTTSQRDVPLTPAQVEIVKGMIQDRQETLLAAVNDLITAAVAPLAAAMVSYGDRVALRVNSGKIACVKEGGPTEDDAPIDLVSRPDVGPWESLQVERGQD